MPKGTLVLLYSLCTTQAVVAKQLVVFSWPKIVDINVKFGKFLGYSDTSQIPHQSKETTGFTSSSHVSQADYHAVSYTHLTLPTIYSV